MSVPATEMTIGERIAVALDDPRPVSRENGWRTVDGYVCNGCTGPALKHPQTTFVWGCEHCNRRTDHGSLHFHPVGVDVLHRSGLRLLLQSDR